MQTIDLAHWNRREHYAFFSQYDNPFFGLVTEIDCTHAYQASRQEQHSFFAYYLHKSIIAVNEVAELRYRIHQGKVVVYNAVHASTTIGRKDGTFGFSFIPFTPDFGSFHQVLSREIEAVENSTGLRANEDTRRIDVVHYSVLPWNRFTGLTHARSFRTEDTVPKITFGRAFAAGEKMMMPVAIDVHHGLVDGLHVARYLEVFQQLMNG